MAQGFTVLIMAAGHGTRMRSSLPKALHPVCGKPMVEWVIAAAREAGAERVVCVTRPGDGVEEGLPDQVTVAEQTEGEGTGAAVLAARDQIQEGTQVVVLSGDHPLVNSEHIEGLLVDQSDANAAAAILTTDQLDPAGYGRIMRGPGNAVERIVETKHTEGLTAEELAVREINLGSYAFDAAQLLEALDRVGLEDGERYLTGVFPLLEGKIVTHLTPDANSAIGVNDRAGLMHAEQIAQGLILEHHAREGVTFHLPTTIRVDAQVEIGPDTVVAPGTSLLGATKVGAGAELGPHTTVIDSRVADQVRAAHSYLLEAVIGEGATIGPFAYLRPGAKIGAGAKVGTFVEVKNSQIGSGAKIPHLSYIGDADVGDESNLGASTITANYDGREKHRTKLGKRVKTGVHTSLVAPVDVGDRAYTGAGSVISEDVPEGSLGITRSDQKNVEGYAERVEKKPE